MSYTDRPDRPDAGGVANIRFDIIVEAWQKVTANPGVWIVTFLLASIIMSITFMVVYLATFLPLGLAVTATGVATQGQGEEASGIIVALLGNFLLFVLVAILGALYAVFMGGMVKMALNQIRGLPISIGDVFNSFPQAVPLMLAGALNTLGVGLGISFCLVPGLILAALWLLTIPLIVDQNMDAITAMKTSMRTLQPQMFMALLLGFLLMLVAGLGKLACGVGVLLTYPLIPIGLALLYRDCFPERFQQPLLPDEGR